MKENTFQSNIKGPPLTFTSVSGVFSFETRVDKASALLIHAFEPTQTEEVPGAILDLGCGYGAIGLSLKARFPQKKLVLTDINNRAADYARKNAVQNYLDVTVVQGNLYETVQNTLFSDIVSNPPIAAGKTITFALIREAKAHLHHGGALWLTAFHNKGGETLKKEMLRVFGNVEDVVKSGGMRVYRSCCKNSENDGSDA